MGKYELMSKYNLSDGTFKSVLYQVDRERRARALALAEDLRKGLSEIEIVTKYQIPGGAFQRIVKVLLEERLVTRTDIESRTHVPHEQSDTDLRKGTRYAPKLPVFVYGRRHTLDRYALKDISEYGFAIKGMKSEVGEVTDIKVLGDEHGQVVPFECRAECRWTKKDLPDGHPTSGFEITTISVENLGHLCKFIAKFAISLG